jgi:hypothetical protein
MLNLQSIYFGQKHKDFTVEDYDLIRKVARLAHKHQAQATNDCNGEGFVNGQHYFNGNIDDWARREYGQNVKSAYIDDSEETIFTKEMEKIEEKINKIIEEYNHKKLFPDRVYTYKKNLPYFGVEFQGDPRGNTVKLYYEGDFIEL